MRANHGSQTCKLHGEFYVMIRSFLLLLAGDAISILIAPEKGAETRKKITDLLKGYKDGIEKLKFKIQ